MLTFREYDRFLRRSVVEAPARITMAIAATMHTVELEAKGYIGGEFTQWAPLSPATLHGFVHPFGFYIPGKIELGYVGHLTATDPLLRTGAMRASIESGAVGLMGVVGSASKIALFQEMGTHNPLTGDIPPRPFMGLAMSRARPQAELFFGRLAVLMLSPPGSQGLLN